MFTFIYALLTILDVIFIALTDLFLQYWYDCLDSVLNTDSNMEGLVAVLTVNLHRHNTPTNTNQPFIIQYLLHIICKICKPNCIIIREYNTDLTHLSKTWLTANHTLSKQQCEKVNVNNFINNVLLMS